MLPIVLDTQQLAVALAGSGELLERRFRLLKAAGVEDLRVYAVETGSRIAEASVGLPAHADLEDVSVLFVAGLEQDAARSLCRLRGRAASW